MSTGDMTEATPMANMNPSGRRLLDSGLNRMIAWAAALLLISVLGFGVYYYVDQSGSGGTSIIERQLVFAEQAVQDDPTNITNAWSWPTSTAPRSARGRDAVPGGWRRPWRRPL